MNSQPLAEMLLDGRIQLVLFGVLALGGVLAVFAVEGIKALAARLQERVSAPQQAFYGNPLLGATMADGGEPLDADKPVDEA